MAFQNRESIDFGNERIPKLFLTIFIPTLIGMLADVVFMLTDGIFVGHSVGPEGLACINLVTPAMMLITGLGVMFGMGGSVVAAIQLAKGNREDARINVTQAMGASIFLSLIVVVIFYSFPERALSFMGVSQELMSLAMEYFIWFIPTCFFIMVQIVGSFIIRLDGSPRYSMMATLIPSLINILLDYIFIFPCAMGLKGAALATDIGTFVGSVMVLVYMFGLADKLRLERIRINLAAIRPTLRNVGNMMKVGFSGFIGEFAISMMILAGNLAFGKYLGDTGIAAYSVICYIFPLVINIYISVSSAAQPIISFNHGAQQESRVCETFRFSVCFSVTFALVVALIFTFFAPSIIAIFLERGSETFLLASKGLPLFAIGYAFMAFNISTVGYFQSVEKSLHSIALTLMRGFVFILTAFLLLPPLAGTPGLWLSVPAAELLTTIFAVIMLSRTSVVKPLSNLR